MTQTVREQMEEREEQILSPHAMLNKNSRGRQRPEQECSLRMAFQRDRDRIIHSKTFRRLKHKTQVFLAPAGDHYRTRLTHALEVAQIARTISKALRINEDLTEAIALGHDLGHTPFGHAGENVLNEVHPGGFNHHKQSLRVVDSIENDGRGLNLSHEVRDGILKHSKGKRAILPDDIAELPGTLEGRVVRVADIIAYINHDIDDAVRAGVIQQKDIPEKIQKTVGKTHSERIGAMVRDLVHRTRQEDNGKLSMSEPVMDAITGLRSFLFENVYEATTVHKDFIKAMKVLRELYFHFLKNNTAQEQEISQVPLAKHREVCDYIAGMTDRYALDKYAEIFLPKPWSVL